MTYWQNFARSWIFARFGKNAGFWPEPDSGATLISSHAMDLAVYVKFSS